MNKRFWIWLTGLAIVMTVISSFPARSAAQSGPSVGNPNLSGIWLNPRGGSCDNENVNSDACGVGPASGRQPRPVQSRIVDPPDGKIPYQPWAREQQQEIAKNFQNPSIDHMDLQNRCFPGGVIRTFTHDPFQFIQIPGYVVMLFENFHVYRIIPLDGRPHLNKNVQLWMGDSRGRWDANTLIVDVTNTNGRMWFDVVGNFHSEAMHVVERFTVADVDTINYEATVEDPKVYTRPWKLVMTFKRSKPGAPGAETELMEWACLEGDREGQTGGILR